MQQSAYRKILLFDFSFFFRQICILFLSRINKPFSADIVYFFTFHDGFIGNLKRNLVIDIEKNYYNCVRVKNCWNVYCYLIPKRRNFGVGVSPTSAFFCFTHFLIFWGWSETWSDVIILFSEINYAFSDIFGLWKTFEWT